MALFAARARMLAGHSAQLLGWTPDTFWRATPSDLMQALGGGAEGDAGIDRAVLQALREAMPDKGNQDG